VVVQDLKSGKQAVGTMVRFVRNPAVAWMVKNSGLDFFMFDVEHGAYDTGNLADSFALARALGIGGFIRVPELSKGYVSKALDAGAVGVMVPMLETPAQAEQLVEWAKFTPVGKRGFGSNGGHTNYGSPKGTTAEFMDMSNRETLTIAQIETEDGVANVEAIAAMDGIDALLIGPNDLSLSLGVPGDLLGDTLHEAIGKVAAAAKANKKIFGLHAPDALLERWIPEGCNMVMSGLDAGILTSGFAAIAKKFK
jgi:4-hydroxy-2-oxoheptanedioate aldolase